MLSGLSEGRESQKELEIVLFAAKTDTSSCQNENEFTQYTAFSITEIKDFQKAQSGK